MIEGRQGFNFWNASKLLGMEGLIFGSRLIRED